MTTLIRWVVFNLWRTSDGHTFEVYVDAPDETRARVVAIEYFRTLAKVVQNDTPEFVDPATFLLARVSS